MLGAAGMRYAVIAAIASTLRDALWMDLFEYDRVAVRLPVLDKSQHTELNRVASTLPLTWELLAVHVEGAAAAGLRTQCLVGASTIAAFVQMRFLGRAREYPWC